jgi:hypothetical protein
MTCILLRSYNTYVQTKEHITNITWTHFDTQCQCQLSTPIIWCNIHV